MTYLLVRLKYHLADILADDADYGLHWLALEGFDWPSERVLAPPRQHLPRRLVFNRGESIHDSDKFPASDFVADFLFVGIATRDFLSWVVGEIRLEAAPLVAAFLPLTGSGFRSVMVVVEEGLFNSLDVEGSR